MTGVQTCALPITDIITNSSSEVFIARNLKSKNHEIIELIQNVAKAANLDLDEILERCV